MLESPPISPKTVRHVKRSRQSSKGEVSVGELSQEDTGYDGDIEVVRPDEVEEPESESEDDDSGLGLKRLLRPWSDTDQELASKMKRLGWMSQPKKEARGNSLERPGAKQLSKEVDFSHLNQHGKRMEIDVSELVDGHHKAPVAKRRKDSRINMAKRIIKGEHEDKSEQTDGRNPPIAETSVSTAPEAQGVEGMDLD